MSFITKELKSLSRNWRVKLLAQNTIGLLPGNIGFRMNERLTRFVRGGMEERQDLPRRFLKGLENIDFIRSTMGGFTIRDKTVLELGTGWHGVDLVIFHLLGAKTIITIDHHAHLTHDNLVLSIKALFENKDVLSRLTTLGGLPERISSLEAQIAQPDSLTALLKLLSVDYKIVTSAQYKNLAIEHESVDLFYSYSVLQRIPEPHLQDLLRVVSELMSDDAVAFHVTDQKDINSQGHVDTGLWGLDYLRHSERVFHLFLSPRFSSQNRLRESDFLKLFDGAGIPPVHVTGFCLQSDIDRLKTFEVAKRFEGKTLEDLATRRSRIVSRKGPLAPSAELKHKLTYLLETIASRSESSGLI